MATGSYRTNFVERDLSGFILPNTNEFGAMVVVSSKGRNDKPIKCESENDIITHFGYPSAENWSVFEAISYARKAPLWCVSAIADDALFGGVDVKADGVAGFGTGRVHPDNFLYAGANSSGSYIIGTGDGLTKQFAGTISDVPLDEGTLKIKIGNAYITVADSGGDISGSDIDAGGTNTINYTSGAIDFTLDGTLGVQEEYDIVAEADSAGSLNDKYFWIFTADTSYYVWFNVNSAGSLTAPSAPSGAPTTVMGIEIAIATNATADAVATAIQSAVNALSDFSASVITATVTITNAKGEVVKEAMDNNTAWSVWTGFSPSTDGADPTGAIPKNGEQVTLEYIYNENISTTVSHSFFASSPYKDDLAVYISYNTGKQFKLVLYKEPSSGTYEYIGEYEYSLEREKNLFGKSLYIFDVFEDDPYLIPVVNSAYTWAVPTITPAYISLSGGDRGGTPQISNYNDSWDHFKKKTKYPVKNFMDVFGNSQTKLKDLRDNYQYYSHCITCIPLGNSTDEAVTARTGFSIDDDHMSVYTNWSKIEDPYNNSYAWISNVGAIGGKYADMADIYDALSPAGIDENNHGGQLSAWKYIESEYYYSDSDLQTLDEAQINPVIHDDVYGMMIYGDKTLQVSLSDTSYVGARRLYNIIIDKVISQVLRKQEFKNNDDYHRLKARSMVDDYMRPIAGLQLIRDFYVQCDEGNNNDVVLEQRKFILDLYIKITPNSQFVQLRLTRLSQTQTIAEFIQ